jgi:hypothetical protein
MKGRCIMIALVLLGLLIALGILSILGWTADSRNDEQKLWPLERRQPDTRRRRPRVMTTASATPHRMPR